MVVLGGLTRNELATLRRVFDTSSAAPIHKMPQGRSYPCRFPSVKSANNGIIAMYSALSLLIGAMLVYGLSFLPSATLGQTKEFEEAVGRADPDGANPDAEDAWSTLVALRDPAGQERRPPDNTV